MWRRLLVLVKNLIRILQNCINNLDLPPGVSNRFSRIGAHERRAENDSEVVGVHAIDVGVVNHSE